MHSQSRQQNWAAWLALGAGVVAVLPGFVLGTWAVLLIPTAVALMDQSPLLGAGLLVGAVLLAVALPALAIWLGRRARGSSRLGQIGWLLGWLALALVVLSGVLLYSVAPAYFRYG